MDPVTQTSAWNRISQNYTKRVEYARFSGKWDLI